MNPSSCPDASRFEALLLAELSPDELEPLTDHLQQCASCGETVERLLADDTLAEALRRQTADDTLPTSPAADALKRRLHAILPQTVASTSSADPDSAELLSFLLPPQTPDELGRLGKYRVLKVLGQGGMGVVFLAEDPQLKRLVALKVMNPSLAARASARQRFLREAEATAAVKNDHVVIIYDVGEDRGMPYLAMELLEGTPMDAWLQGDRRPNLAQVLQIGREIATGLAAAHERGLIHRDIKPANIFLVSGGVVSGEWSDKVVPHHSPLTTHHSPRIKILDFGLVRTAKEDVHLTQNGVILGTPAYMAPEQLHGDEVDHRCDLFSLGCVLYRLTAGTLPFHGSSTTAILVARATQPPRPVRELNPDLPPRLANLIEKLLAKAPADRPASAKAVIAELQAVERELTQADAVPPGKKRSRGPLMVIAVGLAAVVAAVTGIILFLRTPDGKVVQDSREVPVEPKPSEAGPAVVPVGFRETVAEVLTSPHYEWTEPEELSPVVNFAEKHEFPFVSADGLECWYGVSTGKAGDGKFDLWVTRRKSLDSPWEEPTSLGPMVNSAEASEKYPTLAADGLTLMFWRYPTFRLFESNRQAKDADWSEPVVLKNSLNCLAPVLSAYGLELYVTREGKVHRSTRPNRTSEWAGFRPVKELDGGVWLDPCWISADDRSLFLCSLERNRGRWWLAQRDSPLQPWGSPQQLDLPAGLTRQRRPCLVRTPTGLEVYFSKDNKIQVARRVLKAPSGAPAR